MPVRYYPSFKIKPNQITTGGDYFLNGNNYVGLYYTTYDGRAFTGPNSVVGPNEKLTPASAFSNGNVGIYAIAQTSQLSNGFVDQLMKSTKAVNSNSKSLVSYFPNPIQKDYDLGYINRYFGKQINENGYIKEISPQQYDEVTSGDPAYNISMLKVIKIAWKLTGPLNSVRISQYDVRAGIIDTNKRLVEAANPKFFGLIEFIGDNYSKFAKPTA
jgi:hypothetical protein